MDFLNGNIRKLYFKYLAAAFGSALITSIYSIVDMAMVGQYHGPEGAAALAVVAPIWNIIYSLGLLMGIGGSVLFSTIRGQKDGQIRQSNEYFTVSIIGSGILAAAAWLGIIFFDRELLLFFSAEEGTLELAREYVLPIKFVVPCFLFTQTLAAYLRNDKNPALATAAVLAGGIFNIFGDYFFAFTCDMGAMGAGLATAIGTVISVIVMRFHFFTRKNTLRLVRPEGLLRKFGKICSTGFLHALHPYRHGRTDHPVQPPDHGVSGGGRALRLRRDRQYQHLCPVLRLQRGAGLSANLLHQLWRRERGPHPSNAQIRPGEHGLFRHRLGSAVPVDPKSVHPPLYEPDSGSAPDRAGDHPELWPLLPAAAAEYLLHLLFPGADEAAGGACRLHRLRADYQRNPDPAASGCGRGKCDLVRHAADGSAGRSVRRVHDRPVYQTIDHRVKAV